MEGMDFVEEILPVYDYVIVGGGACGCALAARLATSSNRTVLLLEAGGDDRKIPDIAVPGSARRLQMTDCDWQYKGVAHQNAFKAFKDQVFNIPRGKVLGGTGSINYMVYMRGTPHDYDIWKNMGCPEWGYEGVLPYFIKSERCLVSRLVDKGYRGTDGPMMISENKVTQLANVFVEAGKAMGYKETDCNGPDPIGFMLVQSNIADGLRQSSSEAYLRPAMKRENLHVALNCHVTKVLIDKQVARAVEFVRGSARRTRLSVRARQEVVLCAGAIGSAQLLMLSGIGPAGHLKTMGIDVVADLPVGDNLHDHCGTFGIEFKIDEPISVLPEDIACQERQARYGKLKTGPLATNIRDSIALIRSEVQDPSDPNPDICLTSLCSLYGAGHGTAFKAATCIRTEIWESMLCGNLGKHGFGVKIALTHPKSRGTLRLRNPDPFSYPAIDHRCLSHPDDVATILAGIKFVLKLGQTEPMKAIGARFTSRVLPHCTKAPFSDEYWEEYIRSLTFMTYNTGGTCRMGRPEDSTTVVDPQLRVKGVERLRVVDASIMPVLPSAHIYGPCLMIAEKAADMILRKPT